VVTDDRFGPLPTFPAYACAHTPNAGNAGYPPNLSSVIVAVANESVMIPTWLQTHLDAVGAWNADGISRAARAGYCRGCGRVVLRGLDADRAALPVAADPEPLNVLGEFLALSVGRKTFDLHWRGRYELDPREPWHIRARPAQLRGKSAVVVEHSCRDVMPVEGQTLVKNEELESAGCPF
jgi:hypothetical protein